MAKRPTVIDLFAGCGGMSLGFEAAGFDIVASVEFDAIHSLVHHVNFPYSATMCADVSKISSEQIFQKLESVGYGREIDVIVGGPPCQGFSQIGKRILDDPRNGLVFEYLRLVKEIQPKYFVFENVPGIAAGKHRAFLTGLISEFDSMGYSIIQPYQVLNSVNFGTPQKRKRLILMGYRSDMQSPSYPSPTHDQHKGNRADLFELRMKEIVGTSAAISDLLEHDEFIGTDFGIPAENKSYVNGIEHYDFEPSGVFSLCHKRSIERKIWGHIGSQHTKKSIARFLNTEPGYTEPISRFYKLHPSKPCNTLRAGTASDKGAYTAPRPIHYEIPRCITVREAARLHGFPDWFQFHRTIWHGFREIGNAVSPIFGKALGDEIIKVLGVQQSALRVRELKQPELELLSYKMNQASEYWGISDDIIPKRKRLNG